MDFAENSRVRKSVEEVQSAYWTQTGVILHPVAIYHADNDGTENKLNQKSLVIISKGWVTMQQPFLHLLMLLFQRTRKLLLTPEGFAIGQTALPVNIATMHFSMQSQTISIYMACVRRGSILVRDHAIALEVSPNVRLTKRLEAEKQWFRILWTFFLHGPSRMFVHCKMSSSYIFAQMNIRKKQNVLQN